MKASSSLVCCRHKIRVGREREDRDLCDPVDFITETQNSMGKVGFLSQYDMRTKPFALEEH